MVTSKRKITQETETEYQARVSSPAERKSSVTFNDDLMMMRSYVEPSVESAPSEPSYKSAVEQPVRESQVIIEKKPVRVSDIMPVISTRRAVRPETETVKETAVVRESMLSRSMKKALIAYLSIVVVLTIAVIITGVAINSVTAKIDDCDAAANSLTQTIALQQSELDRLSDPEEIGRLAGNLNMVGVNGAHSGELVPVAEAQTVYHTNPFDGFCKWIASIFGG